MHDFKPQFLDWFSQCLTPEHCLPLARLHGWCKRLRVIQPFEFLFAQVYGQLSAVVPSLSTQAQAYTKPVTRQAIDERYTPEAVQYFAAAFDQVLAGSLSRKIPQPTLALLAQKFTAVRLFDSTRFDCSPNLAQIFPGCGGAGSCAGMKVLLTFEYLQSQFRPLALLPAKRSDQGLAHRVGVEVGTHELGLFDKGFYDGSTLSQIHQRNGAFVIPWPRSVSVWERTAAGLLEVKVAHQLRHHAGSCCELANVQLGQGASALVNVRLVAYRLAEPSAQRQRAALREKCRKYGRIPTAEALELASWLILITNVSADKLPSSAVAYVYRLRWQIELVFKQLKSVLRLDQISTSKENRLRCEVWARLLCGVILFTAHRFINAACWAAHQREISFAQLARCIAQEGLELARALCVGGSRLHTVLNRLWDFALKLARKGHQKSRKTTQQNLYENWLELASP